MVTKLELAVDSSGVKAGLVDANRALDETAKKADRAEKEVRDLGDKSAKAGKNMSAAFAATGGGLAVTHGLSGIADGFRRADGSMAAFAASQALLDMGRMAEDMKGVAGATGEATSMFSKMGAIMKAHPIMTIAALLAAAATAMSIFSNDTDDATESVDILGEAIKDLEARSKTQLALSSGMVSGAAPRLSAVSKGYEAIERRGYQSQFSMQDLYRESGVPIAELQRQASQIGAPIVGSGGTATMSREVAQELLKAVYKDLQGILAIERSGVGASFSLGVTGMPRARVPDTYGPPMPDQLPPTSTEAVTNAAQSISDQITAWYGAPLGPPQPTSAASLNALSPQQLAGMSGTLDPQFNLSSFRQKSFGGGGALISGERYAEVETERNQAIAEANQNMQELIMKGEQFGQTIGDAFMRVADGTMTAKQAMAELVRTFAQMGAQSVFKSIGGAVAGGFGTTQTQETYNNNPPQP